MFIDMPPAGTWLAASERPVPYKHHRISPLQSSALVLLRLSPCSPTELVFRNQVPGFYSVCPVVFCSVLLAAPHVGSGLSTVFRAENPIVWLLSERLAGSPVVPPAAPPAPVRQSRGTSAIRRIQPGTSGPPDSPASRGQYFSSAKPAANEPVPSTPLGTTARGPLLAPGRPSSRVRSSIPLR